MKLEMSKARDHLLGNEFPWQKIFCWILILIPLVSSISVYKDGGRYEGEHNQYIPHLLSNRPLIEKIFDIKLNEVPQTPKNFTARELSYVFDYLDVEAQVFFGKLGMANFLSAIKYIFLLLIAISLWRTLRQYFDFDDLSATALIVLFMTSAPAYHYVYFHRTAKVGVALSLTYLFGCISKVMTAQNFEINRVDGAVLIGTSLAAGLFDMQGAFLAAMISGGLGLAMLVYRNKQTKFLFIFSTIGVCTYLAYHYVFATYLMEIIEGYPPESSLVSMDWEQFWNLDMYDAESCILDYFRHFFGNLSHNTALFALGIMLLFNLVYEKLSEKKSILQFWKPMPGFVGFAMFLSLVSMMLMAHVAAIKMVSIYKPSVILIVYALPSMVFFLFGIAITVRRLQKLFPGAKRILGIVLSLLVMSNVYFLPIHKSTLDSNGEGSWGYMEMMMDCLRNLDKDQQTCRQLVPKYKAENLDKLNTDPCFIALSREILR